MNLVHALMVRLEHTLLLSAAAAEWGGPSAVARQVNSVARAVHAPVMDPAGRTMDPKGDQALRAAFSGRLRALLGEARAGAVRDVHDIVDCGCATGALLAQALLRCAGCSRQKNVHDAAQGCRRWSCAGASRRRAR